MAESDRALLILDMTNERIRGAAVPGASVPGSAQAAQIVRYVQGELRYFRERGRPVIFACTAPDLADPPQIIQELTPRADERVMWKSAPSAFFDTDLGETLRELKVRRLTIVGLETHTSVLLTAADAVARGFQVVVPDPCVFASSPQDHQFALRQIREIWPHEIWPQGPHSPQQMASVSLDGGDIDDTGRLRRPPPTDPTNTR